VTRHDPDQVLADTARFPTTDSEPDSALDAIARLALTSLPGIDQVGVALARSGAAIETIAGTGSLVWELDQLQCSSHDGPSVTALEQTGTVVLQHAALEHRWPRFTGPAAARGLRSLLAIRLDAGHKATGVMTMYSTSTDTVDDQTRRLGPLFATHSALAVRHARTVRDLNAVLESRHVIGLACGMLMKAYQIDQDRAFAILTRVSQEKNTKLRKVAQDLVNAAEAEANPASRREVRPQRDRTGAGRAGSRR
jgi:hypothetical protein